MGSVCGEDINLDKPHSDFDNFDELFDDDSDVSEIEIDNPYGARIVDKKLLTCHGCKVAGEYFELKNNVTIIECSRLGYSSTNPRVYRGSVIDTRMLLKKMNDAVTFQDAIDKVRSSIVPKDESSVSKGATFELSKGSRAVSRTGRFVGQPILMQESKIFLRGCLNEYEGIYQLDSEGEIVDISESVYGLRVRVDRHPKKNFKSCSQSDELNDAELKDKEEMNTKYYEALLQKHIIERNNIQAHIQKLVTLRDSCLRDEEILKESHPQKPLVESKIQEYTKKLENMERKIISIRNITEYLIVDGKYFLPGRPYVYLSDILNHPATRDGTLFILKVCKNICGQDSRIHGESRERRRIKGLRRIRSHDDDHGARSTSRVFKQQIGDNSSKSSSSRSSSRRERSRSRSRSSGGGKIARRSKVNRNKHSYKRIQKKRNKKTIKRKMTRK